MAQELTATDLASILMDARNVPERYRGDSDTIAAAINEAQQIIDASPWRLLIDARANAKLIDAAPDMLKALLDIVEVDDRDSRTDPDIAATDEWRAQVITNARAAIAKATHG